MRRSILFFCLILTVSIPELNAVSHDSLTIAPFGRVFIYKPPVPPKSVAVMISGDGGWKYGVIDFSESFSRENALVIGVDILKYIRNLRQRSDECFEIAADFVNLATVVEKRYDLPEYIPPVIMGYSSGATLVYGILAQARPGTFAGGISLGFCPDLRFPRIPCQVNGLTVKADSTGKIFYFQPDARLGNPWIVLHGKVDKVCNYSETAEFVRRTTDAELVTLPNVGHGFAKQSDFMPQWKAAYTRLTEKKEDRIAETQNNEALKNLPLVITGAADKIHSSLLTIFISGDGGWYSFEQSIAGKLASLGIPTIGLDSKKYFWKRRTPEETAAAISETIKYYTGTLRKDSIILIGYSLGAELVPFIVNRLPEEMRSMISMSVLLSPGISTDFEIHVTNMLGLGSSKNIYRVPDEILKMKPVPSLCIFGSDEKTNLPELLKNPSIKISIIPGDHHYEFNTSLIVQTLKKYRVI